MPDDSTGIRRSYAGLGGAGVVGGVACCLGVKLLGGAALVSGIATAFGVSTGLMYFVIGGSTGLTLAAVGFRYRNGWGVPDWLSV